MKTIPLSLLILILFVSAGQLFVSSHKIKSLEHRLTELQTIPPAPVDQQLADAVRTQREQLERLAAIVQSMNKDIRVLTENQKDIVNALK